MKYEPGMILAFRWDTESYGVCKVTGITETRKEPIISIVTYSNSYDSPPEKFDPAEELKPMVLHMPMLLPAIEASECTAIGNAEVSPEEQDGFENWLSAWKERRTGFFKQTIPDAVDHIIEAMAQVESSASEDSMYRERLMQRWRNEGPR
ncbi:MAG: hypothetical protein CVU89_16525 [Firmicutes bacterium HGW-Firmicutes-14]|nr:MAG: hypothetical protein CVU89_16525 [Firmicutes bacterium HGW-Firmicutes-14]